MSEEKPVFKVTDRRLFNSDGTPRDVEREPRPTETATPLPSPELSTPSAPAEAATAAAQARPSATLEPEGSAAASDPLFIELMMFVAENAAAMLSGHPQFGGEVNLPYAKQFIDMLGTLQEKTRGNLTLEEQSTLDTLLSQLRMQYVSLTKARPAATPPPRGFTGSDITGGR